MSIDKKPALNREKVFEKLPQPKTEIINQEQFDVERKGGMVVTESYEASKIPGQELPAGFGVSFSTPPEDTFKKVENILQEDLENVYVKMLPNDQRKFKEKGEETARTIVELLKKPTVKIKKIFQLILNWLRIIPGVNKFYLQQIAKIKADSIIETIKDKKIK